MSNTFKPGDRVRRLTDTDWPEDSTSVFAGQEYTVTGARPTSILLKERPTGFSYAVDQFELVQRAALPGSSQGRSLGFAIGYLSSLSHPAVQRPTGLTDQDREVLNSALSHLERLLEREEDR